MKNASVVLGTAHTAFIRKQVRKGRFGSTSEAVRAGLKMFEEQEFRMERLRVFGLTSKTEVGRLSAA